jgi:hypothetical protein
MPDQKQPPLPLTVLEVKKVEWVLVKYADHESVERVQLMFVGDNTAVLVNGNPFGITNGRNEQSGVVNKKLRDAVLLAMGKEVPKDVP